MPKRKLSIKPTIKQLINHQYARDEVMNATIAWWRLRRPADFTEKQHLENPTINTTSRQEQRLARAAAKLVVSRKEVRRVRRSESRKVAKKK